MPHWATLHTVKFQLTKNCIYVMPPLSTLTTSSLTPRVWQFRFQTVNTVRNDCFPRSLAECTTSVCGARSHVQNQWDLAEMTRNYSFPGNLKHEFQSSKLTEEWTSNYAAFVFWFILKLQIYFFARHIFHINSEWIMVSQKHFPTPRVSK